jgi:PAS domain S-box-containing protein
MSFASEKVTPGAGRLLLGASFPLAAFLVQWIFWSTIQPYVWFLFYPAVFFSSWLCGLRGGLLATATSTLLVWWFFIPPRYSFALERSTSAISILIFAGMGVLFSLTHERLKRANRATADALAEVNAARDHLEARITERTADLAQTIDALMQSEAKYRQTLDSMLEGCQVIGFDWRYRYLNGTAERHNRRPADELLGRTVMECWPGITATRVFALEQSCMSGRTIHNLENEFAFPDGYRGWFRLIIQPVAEGIVIYSEDITERKLAEQALAESESAFRASFHQAAVGMAQVALDGRWLRVNQRLCDIVGYRSEELLELGFQDITHPDDLDSDLACVEQVLAGEVDTYAMEKRYLRKDGTLVWVNLTVGLVRDGGGAPCYFVSVVEDITERKESGAALLRLNGELEQRVAERTVQLEALNKELEAFSYSVSHDLKAPLRGIDGYSQLLEKDYRDRLDDDGRLFIRNIRSSAAQMHQLIEDLLNYSRMERRSLQPVGIDLGALVQAVVGERAAEIERGGIRLVLELPQLEVRADRDGLALVLRNLLENALKFSRKTEAPQVVIGARAEGGRALVWVADNGIGFDMKFHDRIFDIFQRLQRAEDYPGTGVGLALVRKAMQRMEGRVWAESVPGAGAQFYLEIPL